ncbi:unnamed protein product [Debaryomyces tyrocola]|nr:unnamed protein product [Debaryomyces tyrocola]
MLFNTEQLDSKLDSLTLGDSYKQENFNKNNRSNSENISNITQGTVLTTQGKRSYIDKPKTSLLSSSLAKDRQFPHTNANALSPTVSERNDNLYLNIDDRVDTKTNFTDDHPEPILLASSVGKEIDGRMIPSSSTISLLSLNGQNNGQGGCFETTELDGNGGSSAHGTMTSPKNSNNQFAGNYNYSHVTSNTTPQTAFMDRKLGHNNITSRNSLTHLNQIRLQPYQRFSSPSSQQPFIQQETTSSTTCQSIPIENKSSMIVPDSPSLDPTSVGGSPSGLWLSSQTPSKPSVDSFKNNSRSQLFHMMQSQQQQQQQQYESMQPADQIHSIQPTLQSTNQLIYNANASNNYTTTSTISYLKIDGSTSPILHPVQTPSEDPPMTPLYLNSNSLSQNDVGYFGNLAE